MSSVQVEHAKLQIETMEKIDPAKEEVKELEQAIMPLNDRLNELRVESTEHGRLLREKSNHIK